MDIAASPSAPIVPVDASLAVDPFAGAVLPALSPYLGLAATIGLLAFILRKGFELSFGGK